MQTGEQATRNDEKGGGTQNNYRDSKQLNLINLCQPGCSVFV